MTELPHVNQNYFLTIESDSRCSALLCDTATAAEELLEAWNHVTDVPKDCYELADQKNDADDSILGCEAKQKDQEEGGDDSDRSNSPLLAEHFSGAQEAPEKPRQRRQSTYNYNAFEEASEQKCLLLSMRLH